jgi:hypothetical protein
MHFLLCVLLYKRGGWFLTGCKEGREPGAPDSCRVRARWSCRAAYNSREGHGVTITCVSHVIHGCMESILVPAHVPLTGHQQAAGADAVAIVLTACSKLHPPVLRFGAI